ncbi:MAG: molybdopterin-dependent oxidoreductase, partial [Planctomycetes bacterium]|nr:molybdopterin-dependent oxidoreductase [Planctomycetota bacterium]
RATVLGGLAIIEAAKKLKADLDKHSALSSQLSALSPQPSTLSPESSVLSPLIGRQYRGDYACIYTNKLGADVPEPKTHLTYGFATQVVILDDEGLLKKVIAAHDVGKVMNPTLLEGQMEGSIHMGLGYALTEDFVVEGGRIQSKDVMSLGVLRAHQMPEIETIFIEEPDPETAYGARGVGEIGLVPTAPAVAAALEAYDGIHRTKLPMKDAPAAQALLGVKRRA